MPEIENNKEMIPFEHYAERFRALDPCEAANRCGVKYDEANGIFQLRLLYENYRVYHPDFRIESDSPDALALTSKPAQMLLIRYLLEGRSSPVGAAFLPYREMPWGEVYLKQFTGRCITRAAYAFAPKLPAFTAAMERLGALPVGKGDAGYQFELMPGYEMRILLWEGDDEFPPNAQILFSENFPLSFSAEDRTVAGDLFITDFKRRMSRS